MSPASTYICHAGQAWDQIAFELWGREGLTHELLAANPQHRHLAILSADLKIIVPAIVIPPIEEPPPWQER